MNILFECNFMYQMQIQPTLIYQIFMPSTFGLTLAYDGISSLTRLQKLLIANYWEAWQKKKLKIHFPCR